MFILVRNSYKEPAREISYETGRRRGKEGPRDSRHERAVKRRRIQSAEGSRRGQSAEGGSQEKVSQEMRAG